MTERRSLGGSVVEDGLARAGFRLPAPAGVSLVETARPGPRAFDTVLAQNAWTVIPGAERRGRLRNYPRARRPRFHARAVAGRLNLLRARQVVCLSETMARWCREVAPRATVVSPVTLPLDFLEADLIDNGPDSLHPPGAMLVPGTLAPYKNPDRALEVFSSERDRLGLDSVVFAGSDDGSGAWQHVQRRARDEGIVVQRRVLDRGEMRTAIRSARLVAVVSDLESLSLSAAEALAEADEVVLSPIPAHRELAERIGRRPRWWSQGRSDGNCEDRTAIKADDLAQRVRSEWTALGETLRLERTT